MSLFTLSLYLTVAGKLEQVKPTARAWDWQPGETLTDPGGSGLKGRPYHGFQLYLAEGCTYCHTQYVRPQDIKTGWAPGAKRADVAQPGDYQHYPFTLLGTQRNGPDLTVIGRRIPDMSYQIKHLQDPRQFKPASIMPNYDYLSQSDLRDIAAYLVSLGNPPDKLKSGELAAAAQPETQLSGPADKGHKLFRSLGCAGCHSVNGSQNVGPTLQNVFGHKVTLSDGATVTADADYLRESITHPHAKIVKGFPPVMPPSFSGLSKDKLDALLAYLESLSDKQE